jgi:signal transduction histidine kinase
VKCAASPTLRNKLGFVREVSAQAVVATLSDVRFTPPSSAQAVSSADFPKLRKIRGFANELRQLFANLIVNAADAMPAAGAVPARLPRP